MTGAKNAYRQRRSRRRGLVAFNNFVLAMLSMNAFNQNEANEKRALRVRASDHRPLVMHYDHAKDETVTLSESRREHWPVNNTVVGYPSGYGKPGQNLRRHVEKPAAKSVLSRLLGRA